MPSPSLLGLDAPRSRGRRLVPPEVPHRRVEQFGGELVEGAGSRALVDPIGAVDEVLPRERQGPHPAVPFGPCGGAIAPSSWWRRIDPCGTGRAKALLTFQPAPPKSVWAVLGHARCRPGRRKA